MARVAETNYMYLVGPFISARGVVNGSVRASVRQSLFERCGGFCVGAGLIGIGGIRIAKAVQ